MEDVNRVQMSGSLSWFCRRWLGGLRQVACLPEPLAVEPGGDSLTGGLWGSKQM